MIIRPPIHYALSKFHDIKNQGFLGTYSLHNYEFQIRGVIEAITNRPTFNICVRIPFTCTIKQIYSIFSVHDNTTHRNQVSFLVFYSSFDFKFSSGHFYTNAYITAGISLKQEITS